jgi:ribose transport system permease protein
MSTLQADEAVARDQSQAAGPSRATRLVLEFGMVWVLIALVIVSAILYPGFLDLANLRNILSQNAPVGMVAIGMTFVLLAGGFDLSVGSILAIGAVMYAMLADHLPLGLAALVSMGIGLAAGCVNGLIITWLRVNPFVATLGTGSAFGGAAFLVSKSAPVVTKKPSFGDLGSLGVAGVPFTIIVLVIAFAAGWFTLSRTVYGRSVFAVGGNDEAARLAGMRVRLIRGSTYAITGVCSVVGGMMLASRLGVGQADMGGTVALDAIAIVVIGGTSLLGGEGAMWRTGVGLLILATLNNLFDSLALDQNWQSLVKGVIVVGAVALDAFSRTRRT